MRPSLAFGFVVFASAIGVSALFVVFGTFTSESPLRQGFMATAIGGLFVLAALLISGSLRLETHSELQGLAEHYGLDTRGSIPILRRRILVYLERERSKGARFPSTTESTKGGDGVDSGAPAPALPTDSLETFNRDIPKELVKEGKYLLALAKLFHADVTPYSKTLARVHRAAQGGRYEEWLEAMKEGNKQLRALLEETSTEES